MVVSCSPSVAGKQNVPHYGIVVHGGAGAFVRASSSEYTRRRAVLRRCVDTGFEVLKAGGSSVDAVERAIKIMEDSRVFNAGAGACLTLDGRILADAAMMIGQLECGAIASGNVAQNPISLARAVMERSDHVLIAGSDNLERFAQAVGFRVQPLAPSKERLKQYEKLCNSPRSIPEWPKNMKLARRYDIARLNASSLREPGKNDTVGAVALDKSGALCSGVSTGGRWLKLPGRVGDSAIFGAGIYAEGRSGAACATGSGEEIIRVCLCKTACDFMRAGMSAQSACDAAIDVLTQARGPHTGGLIAIDSRGGFGASRNTEMMSRAYRFSSMKGGGRVLVLPGEERGSKEQAIRSIRGGSSEVIKAAGRY